MTKNYFKSFTVETVYFDLLHSKRHKLSNGIENTEIVRLDH